MLLNEIDSRFKFLSRTILKLYRKGALPQTMCVWFSTTQYSVRLKPIFWFRSNTETEAQNGRNQISKKEISDSMKYFSIMKGTLKKQIYCQILKILVYLSSISRFLKQINTYPLKNWENMRKNVSEKKV